MGDRIVPPSAMSRLLVRGRDEVIDVLSAAFPTLDVQIGRLHADEEVVLQADTAGDARLGYQRMSMTGWATTTGDLGAVTMVGLARRGGLEVATGRTSVDPARPFLYPHGTYRGAASDLELDMLAVASTDLERAARSVSDDTEHVLRFTGSAPVNAAAGRYWSLTLRHVAAILTDPALTASPLLRGDALATTVRAMLLTFPNTAIDADRPGGGGVAVHVVDAATSFIEANADGPIDIDDIATAANVRPRALVRVFRARHDATPLQYLRSVRMARARVDLVDADPWGTDTVAGIAHHWGFDHLGRFAAEYRHRFGEQPSATLRR